MPISLAQYWDQLDRHDWFFNFSDDGSVYRRGEARESELMAIAKQSPAHQELFDHFKKYHFSGPSWNTPKAPKPERPEEDDAEAAS